MVPGLAERVAAQGALETEATLDPPTGPAPEQVAGAARPRSIAQHGHHPKGKGKETVLCE